MPSSFISRDAMCRDQNLTREQCRTSYRLPSAQRRLLNAFPSHMVTFLCGVKERIGCTGCRRRGQRQSDVLGERQTGTGMKQRSLMETKVHLPPAAAGCQSLRRRHLLRIITVLLEEHRSFKLMRNHKLET